MKLLTVTGAVCEVSDGVLRLMPGEEPKLSVPRLLHGNWQLQKYIFL